MRSSTGRLTRSARSMSARASRASGGRARTSAIASWGSVRSVVETSLPSTASATRWRSQVSKGSAGSGKRGLTRWAAGR